MTETRPSAPEATAPVPITPAPADPPGLAGWLTTSDHKRVGRLWVGTSLVFLLAGAVVAALLGFEGTSSGFDIFDRSSFAQAWSFRNEALTLLFLAPMFLGLATFVVPLQVGAPEIAFPRGSAAAYWLYLVSAAIVVGAYLADGGPAGTSRDAADLWLLGLLGVLLALVIGLVSVLTTALAGRAPGLPMRHLPAFSWSMVVAGSLWLLTLPVLAANLLVHYVSHHFGGDFGNYATDVSWLWSIPSVYLFAIPAAGVALEVVPVLARNRVRMHGASMILLGLLGVVGVGMWAQVPDTFDDVLYVLMGVVAVIPALALLGLVGDTIRGGRPTLRAPLLLAVGSLLLLLLGTVAGALLAIEPLDLQGTSWAIGQFHLIVLGAGTLGGLAGLWWWAPKLWGAELSAGAGLLAGLAVLGGSLVLAVPELINGLANDLPQRIVDFQGDDSIRALNGVSGAGAVLVALGALLAVVALFGAARRRGRVAVADDPWGGHTLEWATTSPPPPSNFSAPVPVTTSATPLLVDEEVR